jgi:hypothetical protein
MQTKILYKKNIIEKLNLLPENKLEEVDNFIQFILYRYEINSAVNTTYASKIETHFASEAVLSKDWLSNEEEEAWKHL